jgi:hypothetical protein
MERQVSALANVDEIPAGGKECGAEYERPLGRLRGDRRVRCNRPFGHEGDHEEHDFAAAEVICRWERQYQPGRAPRQLGALSELVDGLNREVRALAAEVAEVRKAQQGPMRTTEGARIPPLPRWLVDAAGRTHDSGLALGFAGSAWVSAWMAAQAGDMSHELEATDG